jgi:transcriptional regulator with XRE-family HTH domain
MSGISSDSRDSRRTVIGERIRYRRIEQGLSVAQLAEKSGFNQSTISRIENGKLKPSEANISRLAKALGLSKTEKQEFMDLVNIIKAEFSPWLSGSAADIAETQRIFRARELNAKQIRNFEMFFVSGLLQTPDYMNAVFRRVGVVGSDLREVIESRRERQKIWADKNRDINIVLWEPVLRSRILPVSEHKQQLRHILSMAENNEESIRILPMDVILDIAVVNAFWMFDNALVSIETLFAHS